MGVMECGMKLGVVAGGESVLGVGVGVGVGVGLYGGTFFYDILPNFSYWGLEFLLPTLPPNPFLCTCKELRKFSFVVPTTEAIATE